MANVTDNFAEGEAKNFAAMVTNVEENGVTIKQWSTEQLKAFEAAWLEVAGELAAEDAHFKKSGTTFRNSAKATRPGATTSICRVPGTEGASET